MKAFKIVNGDLSDGYHTFDELYEHRCLLFINLVLNYPRWASWKREHFEGWDCIYLEFPAGQISYHIPARMRELYEGKISESPHYRFDGHTPADVVQRLWDSAKSFKKESPK